MRLVCTVLTGIIYIVLRLSSSLNGTYPENQILGTLKNVKIKKKKKNGEK